MPTIARIGRDGVMIAVSAVCFLCVSPVWAELPTAPGLNDLVVCEPGVHERGLPAVQFRSPEGGRGLCVDIPPAVHIHRYYFSGEREIQGPIIQGGPTVVVANHPKTGERMYIDVMLPAGAPRIAYRKSCITYVYPQQRVVVDFSHFPFSSQRVIVRYHSGQGIGRKMDAWRHHLVDHTKQHLAQSSAINSLKQASSDTGKLLLGAGESVGSLTSGAIDGAKSAVDLIPGVVPLRSMAEQRPNRQYQDTIRQAARAGTLGEMSFVPTNR